MAYGDFKDLTRRRASDKILCDNIARNPKYDGYQWVLASMVYKFLIKRLLVEVLKMRIFKKKELVRQLHKPTIRKFKRRKVQSPFIDNTWCADLADMH